MIVAGLRRNKEPDCTTDKAENLQRHASEPVGQQNGRDNADDQENIDQGRTLGGNQIIGDQVGDVLRVLAFVADGGRQDGRREYADAVGAEVLQKPRD